MENESIRAFSKATFGNKYRLELAAAIASAEPPVVSATQLSEAIGVPPNMVREDLVKFADVALLIRLPRPRGQSLQEFQRVESGYWDNALELLSYLLRNPDRTRPDRSRSRAGRSN